MLNIPEVYVVVEAGVVTVVYSTQDVPVVVIDTDMEDYDSEVLKCAQSLPRAG